MSVHWLDWCWSWNSNTLATWCKELIHLNRPWCWERLSAAGEGDDRGWHGWMASPPRWTWVWVNSRSWWWTEKPGMLQSMGVAKSETWLSDWATTTWKVLVAQSCLTLCNPMSCSTLGFPVLHYLQEFAQTHVHWLGDAIQLSHPPSSSSAFSLFQHQGLFYKPALCLRQPKYWSFSFSISPSNEYSGLISFRIDWFDILAVQGTLKSLLQHHSLKASMLWCSAFFMVRLSTLNPYVTTGKTIALTRWTFVGKILSLLFNMLSRLVIAFLPRSKHLLISWL